MGNANQGKPQHHYHHLIRNSTVHNADIPTPLSLPELNGHDVYQITVAQLQDHYAAGHFTITELVSHLLNYIKTLNPHLRAVIETNPDAVSIAQQLDDDDKQRNNRSKLLYGVPVLVKDNMATRDKMQTTSGSWALYGCRVASDAFIVSRLREAGAVILGHANMCEWASVRSFQFSTGYSARGGQIRNPFDLRKNPFGSSGGSAVAVATGMVPLAFGTETDTSIIGPAITDGVVGLKPTVGLTSRQGVIPISEHMDSAGPYGGCVADAAAGLDAIAGEDEGDEFTRAPERKKAKSYVACLATADSLRGARFGLPKSRCWDLAPENCKVVASGVFDAMRRAGAEIVEVELPSIFERTKEDGNWDWKHGEVSRSEWTVAKSDAYNGINSWLASLETSPARTLEEILEFNVKHADVEGGTPGDMPAFPKGQKNFEEVVQSRGTRDESYYAALKHMREQTRENGIDAALRYHRPDGQGGEKKKDEGKDEEKEEVELDALLFCDHKCVGQQYAAQAGYPIICLPIGLDEERLPVGLSLQHTAWREAELIKWASAIEDLLRRDMGLGRLKPTFRNLGADNIPIENR